MTLNDKANRLLEIKALMASLEKEKSAIETEFKERGSFQTSEFDVAVSETTRFYMKGVDTVIDALGEEVLLQHELVTKSTFKTVKVAKKQAKVA